MKRTPILFVLNLREGTRARVFLNDLPVHKGFTAGPSSMTGGANPWLVPGENTLSMEILRAPAALPEVLKGGADAPHRAGLMSGNIEMMLYTVLDPDRKPPAIHIIHQCAFPALWGAVPEARRRLPYHHVERFVIPTEVYRPVYLAAPPTTFGCEGTEELRQAVLDLHASLTERDVDRFLEHTALRMEERARAFEGVRAMDAAGRRREIATLLSQRLKVKPLDMSALHFEPRVGGRVAHVTAADDRPVIEVENEDDPVRGVSINLLLTQHAGKWRVFG